MDTSSQTTRRRFLRSSALTALSTLTLPAFVPRRVLGSANAPGANEQIVLGIIGMGQRGNQLLGVGPSGAKETPGVRSFLAPTPATPKFGEEPIFLQTNRTPKSWCPGVVGGSGGAKKPVFSIVSGRQPVIGYISNLFRG
jgi:hypothetical protein